MNPRLTAFLAALEHAADDEFCSPPGLGGTWRVRHIRRGMDREVLVVHSTGEGLAIAQPATHGACGECKGHKGSQPCEHCACAMCTWFRQADERASPRVSRDKLQALARRLASFQLGGAPKPSTAPDILGDI